MEVKNAGTHAGWFSSYMDNDQGVALIECLQNKIQQQKDLLERITGEIELAERPKEESSATVLYSIKAMIEQKEEVSAERGYFRGDSQFLALRFPFLRCVVIRPKLIEPDFAISIARRTLCPSSSRAEIIILLILQEPAISISLILIPFNSLKYTTTPNSISGQVN